jgi:hypothetical protein
VRHKNERNIPIGMQKVYRQLERWRRKRRGRSAIPKPLWAAAAAVAREHGINQTSQELHLEFNKLKEFVQSGKRPKRRAHPGPKFVELMTSPPTGVCECVIELEGPRGKVRIQWKGITPPDLAGLSRTFWEQA